MSDSNIKLAETLERMATECKDGFEGETGNPETFLPGVISGFFADDMQEAARIIRDHATLEEALANAVSEVDVLTGQLSTLQAAKRGWCSGLDLSLKLCKVFFVWLPCVVFLSFPAYLAGYAWCWIVGGLRAGELVFTNDRDSALNKCWKVELRYEEPSK